MPSLPGFGPKVPGLGNLSQAATGKKELPKLSSTGKKSVLRKKIAVRQIANSLIKNTYWNTWISEITIPKYITGDMFDKHFAQEIKENPKVAPRKNSHFEEHKKIITLFDDKRSRNLSIILSRFTVSSTDLHRILDNFETKALLHSN